jgi:hypothetical protein
VNEQRFCLKLQLACHAGHEEDGYLELRPLKPEGRQEFFSVRDLRGAADAVMHLRDRHEVFVGVNPRTERRGTTEAVAHSWNLPADCDTPDAVARLREFRPSPSIVNETSPGHLQAFWSLCEPLAPEHHRGACLRLATALRSDPACADPPRVMRPVASFNSKRPDPWLVKCLHWDTTTFTAREIVGGLPDAEQVLPTRRPVHPPRSASPASVAGLIATVAGAQPGNRNRSLFWAACRVRDHRGDLDEHQAREALRDAALAAGLDEREIEATLRSALDSRAAA